MDLAYGRGVDKLVAYCQMKIDVMVEAGVRPLVVFDGNRLIAKEGVEENR